MELKAGTTYSHSADFTYIESALKARWTPFLLLLDEYATFVPRSIDDFSAHRASALVRLKELNPASTDDELLRLIDGQISAAANPGIQISTKFSDRIMAEYVTVAFLAHALAEATINAILAIGLATSGVEDLFSLLERAEIKEKWITSPKAFNPAYSFPRDSALFQTLQHLTRQRNAFVHYKIELEMDGEKKLKGSRLDRVPLNTQIEWIRRFFSLPYDLAAHARSQLPLVAPLMLWDSAPIQRFPAHTVPPR